jgi:hypothetical protein
MCDRPSSLWQLTLSGSDQLYHMGLYLSASQNLDLAATQVLINYFEKWKHPSTKANTLVANNKTSYVHI